MKVVKNKKNTIWKIVMRYCKVCKLFCNVSGLLIRYRCYRLLHNRSYACNFYNVFYSKCSSSKLEVSLLSACLCRAYKSQRVFTKLELTTQFLQLGSHLHQDTCLNRIYLIKDRILPKSQNV